MVATDTQARTRQVPKTSVAGHVVGATHPDGPPYPEHPTDPAVRRRAAEQARALLDATRNGPGMVDPWSASDEDLDAIVDLVVGSVLGTVAVAVAEWETSRDASGTPADVAAAGRVVSAVPSPAKRKKDARPRSPAGQRNSRRKVAPGKVAPGKVA